MNEPKKIETVVYQDEAGAEVCWRKSGCQHQPFCHRKNINGEIVETCPHVSYKRDVLVKDGVTEYCSAVDRPISLNTEWAEAWKK